ncbi:MAG: phosphatidate cytidylyltransferase [Balneolales bacterium]
MTELTKRILFALIAAPLFLLMLWLGGWYFKVLVVIIGLFIQREMMLMFQKTGHEQNAFAAYGLGLVTMLFFQLPHPLLIGFLIFLYLVTTETLNLKPGHLDRMVSTLFCGLYAPFALLSLILLREYGMEVTGFALAGSLILVIWGTDIMAYIGGKRFGKNLLAPAISPGKTREGFYFGFLGGLLGLIMASFLIPSYPYEFLYVLPIVIIVGFFGPVGDLAESRMKRSAGLKDSSSILPGHGGVFDRFDALLLASPAVYVYVVLILG